MGWGVWRVYGCSWWLIVGGCEAWAMVDSGKWVCGSGLVLFGMGEAFEREGYIAMEPCARGSGRWMYGEREGK